MTSKPYSSKTKNTEGRKKPVLDRGKKVLYNTNKKVSLKSLLSARIRLQGSVTKKNYEWSKAGTIVDVDEKDAPDLLTKKLGEKFCCGGSPNMLFELVN